MKLDFTAAAVVDFPLRGEWRAVNTPAERVPSHGTDYFGQRYAYDFMRFDATGISLKVEDFRQLPGASLSFDDVLSLATAIKGQIESGADGVRAPNAP